MENEVSQLNEVISALKEEKVNLEKSLYSNQQQLAKLQEEKSDVLRELDIQRSSVSTLQ
ncbi:hypothetical protein AVEN_24394-1, partial [Araneus ventricosus]